MEILKHKHKEGTMIGYRNNQLSTIDSREVAQMLGKEHSYVLEMIQGRKGKLGIIPVLENANLAVSNYFIPSTYRSGTREYKYYEVTKMGCELLGNKQQGEKGILFTAKYVERFNEMEQHIKVKDINTSELSPHLQMFNQMFQAMANTELEVKRVKEITEETNKKLKDTKEEIQGIRDVVAINTNTISWREDCRKLIVKMAHKLGGNGFIADVNKEIYSLMRIRLKCKLDVQLTNMRRRMADEGICKSKRDRLNYLDVIERDCRLIEGYVAIVKDLAIKYGVS